MTSLARDPERARKQAARAGEVMSTLSWQRQRETYFEVIDRLAARGRG
jgi:hypothetical protein